MDGDTFREAVEDATGTQLNRLGSGKLLLALTDATLETEAVLSAAARTESAAAETFREWAADESHDPARTAFEEAAARAENRVERVTADLADFESPETPGPMDAYLRDLEGTVPRVAGGLVGRPLVAVRSHTQIVSFFVNEADTARADRFREFKRETERDLETGLDLLETLCADDGGDRARSVCEETVQVAYDDYADALRGMGLDPKPVC